MAATADKSKPFFPLSGIANDGWTKEDEATATCFCGTVQLAFPTNKPGLVNTFICHCYDCRKITASMFASNFTVRDERLRVLRGGDALRAWGQAHSIASGKRMTNHFCGNCGTLMYRVGEKWPGMSIMRVGTVDDWSLQETKLRPEVELFTKDRASFVAAVEGIPKCKDMDDPE